LILKSGFAQRTQRAQRKRTNRYQAVAFHLIDLGFYLNENLEFLCGLRFEAPTFGATLHELMLFLS
jgi:hypothetical protein